jgi:hypothetical protein
MMNDEDRLFDAKKQSFAITHNLKGNSIEEWVKQYKANELFRQRKRTDSVLLTHEILSWHRDDAKNITLEKMEDMAREYIRQRNPNGIFVAVPHFDKQHFHIHICASGVEYKTGKSLRLPKADLQKLKKEIQDYQVEKFPELTKSVVAHGKNEKSVLTEKEYQVKLRTGRETNKELVIAILKSCYKKAISKETFFELLKKNNLKTYDRQGNTTGVVYEGIKFRFNRLGFTEERFEGLDRFEKRETGLYERRSSKVENTIER